MGRVDGGLFKMVELTVTVSGGQAYVHAPAARWAPAPASVTASTVNAAWESGTPGTPVASAGGSGYGVSALLAHATSRVPLRNGQHFEHAAGGQIGGSRSGGGRPSASPSSAGSQLSSA